MNLKTLMKKPLKGQFPTPCSCPIAEYTVDIAVQDINSVDDALISQLEIDCYQLLDVSMKQEIVRAANYELSVVLCSDQFIRNLNKHWRDKNEATDVLSFPQDDDELLGDIIISVDTARRQAEERCYSLYDELRVLLVHGFLHLVGFDHEEEEMRNKMSQAETHLLYSLKWKGQGLVSSSYS
eukprot:jgi/Galph1/3639/GphlegSOOS_G2252.1